MQKRYGEGIHATGNFDRAQNLRFGRLVFEKRQKLLRKKNSDKIKISAFARPKTFGAKKIGVVA